MPKYLTEHPVKKNFMTETILFRMTSMKISHIDTPSRHQTKISRYKDFHEIQQDNHEAFSAEVKKTIAENRLKDHHAKIQEEVNREKSELFHPPYHKALMLKKLRAF